MEKCGIRCQLGTPTFTSSPVIGLSNNIVEEATDTQIIGPSSCHIGPPPPQVVVLVGAVHTSAPARQWS